MSDMNIKSSVQATALTSLRNVDVNDKHAADKSQDVRSTETRTDTISLTDAAVELPSLQQTISDSSGMDNERVGALRTAIAEGSYSVDVTELAHNMINFEQGL
ncbi:MAG: flagellar biosynthesis anti-sigma factor FlgM [Piscirickettsiaceae bacterium]|nr:flagellar biosynthesis anti-sigma factor FlgM [Piscirickettsiaceae bacterium]